MNTRFLPSIDDRFDNGDKTITNVPGIAGFIPKIMMKKITIVCLFVLFAISGLSAQVNNSPVTTAPKITMATPPSAVTVNVPITVANFSDVRAITLSINYDPAVLTPLGPWATPLSYTYDNTIFPGLLVSNPLPGKILVTWYGSSAAIPSLPDNTPVLTLNFSYNGGTSLVTFTNSPTSHSEYADGAGNNYIDNNPTSDAYISGYVTDLSATATYTNICAPGNVGVITVTASGGSGVYEYSIDNGTTWVNGASPYSFTGLAAGVYQVMVRDFGVSLPIVTIPVGTFTPPLYNVNQSTYHCFIQEAVDLATAGDVINVILFPWTFTENVTINKAVTINGDPLNPGSAIIDGGALGTVVNITANNVNLKGFKVQNSGTGAGVLFNNVSNVVVQNNIITGNANGVQVNGSFNTGNLLSLNHIAGNTFGMLLNLTNPSELVTASLNWWGDAEGPYNAIYNTCGGGNGVSDNVIFHPWYVDAAMTTTATLPFYNATTGRHYCTVQDAAAHASSNDVIHALYAGTYDGLNYNFSKTLTILNVSSGTVTFTGTVSPLVVSAGDLTINGIDFTTASDVPTVLVSAGKLTLRSTNVYESTAFDQTGVLVTGGVLDAGTATTDKGLNRFLSDGNGLSMNNTGGVVNAICNHWGSNYYAIIFPKITGTISYDPWSDYNFTMCDVLTRFGGPITYAPKIITVPGAVNIPITVEQFRHVDAISLVLEYDKNVIQYTGFTANSPQSVGMYVNANNSTGKLKIGRYGAEVPFIADFETLITLHFSFAGGTSLLTWNDDLPVNCEYQNALIQYPYIDTPQGVFYYDGWITDLDAVSVTSTNVICKNTQSGTVTINGASGGSGAYQYSIDCGTTWQASNLFYVYDGTYCVMIRDANFPFIMITLNPALVITEPALPLAATAAYTKRVRCKGESNGAAAVTPVGGWGNYTYKWSDPLAQTTPEADSLAAGYYTVTVTDMGGCAVVAGVFVIEPTLAFTATATQTKVVTCFGGSDGSITVNAANGWGYYMYSINNITYYNYLTSNVITGLPAGNYTVHIFDDERCELYLPVTIQQPAVALSVTALETKAATCYGAANGEITATPAGGWGVNSYSFSIDAGATWQTSPVFANLLAGTYTIQVKDSLGCVALSSPTIVTEPSMLTGVISGTTDICYGFNAQIAIGITGGTPPYNVTYSDGTNQFNVPNVTSSPLMITVNPTATTTYTLVSLTDANNCTSTLSGSAVITVNPLPAVGFSFNGNLAGTNSVFKYCYDDVVNVALTHIWAGTAPFDLVWTIDDGSGPVTHTANGVVLNDSLFTSTLAPGSYTIQITSIVDAKGCTPVDYTPYVATVVVNDEPMISFGFNGVEAGHNASFAYCYNETVEVKLYAIYGGIAPYDITYEVNGVTTTVTGVALGGVISTAQLYAAGVYQIVVTNITDANGCEASDDFLNLATATITIHSEPMISFGFNGVEAGHNASFTYCYDQPVGVTLYGIYGGTAPYSVTYEVNGVTSTVNGLGIGGVISSSQIYTPGVYQVVVTDITDVHGCKASPAFLSLATATVTVNAEPMISFGFNGVEAGHNAAFEYCYNEPVEVTLYGIYGGTAPYSVTYEVNGVTSTVSNLSTGSVISASQTYAPGVYQVVVTNITDANGCEASTAFLSLATATITIHEAPMVSFAFNGVEAGHNATFEYCYNQPVGVTLYNYYGGTAPYSVTYTVNGGTPVTVTGLEYGDPIIAPQTYTPGVYQIVVTNITDDNGCVATPAFLAYCQATVTITTEPMISFGFNGVEAGHNASFTYCYNQPVGVTLYGIYGGTAPYSVTYELDGVTTTVTGLNLSDVIAAAQTYPAGVHTVVVTNITDAKGCQASPAFLSLCTATININPEPAVGFSFNGNLAGTGSTFTYCYTDPISVTLSHIWAGTAPFDVTWTVDNGTGPIAYSALGVGLNGPLFSGNYLPGTYTVQITSITDANGCFAQNYAPYIATIVVNGFTVSGYYNYYNAYETPLNNITIALKQNGVIVASDTTDINGYYYFPGICPGTFEVISTTIKPTGGINSTDATQVNAWANSVTPPNVAAPIEMVEFFAGNVAPLGNPDLNIIAADALAIMNNFTFVNQPAYQFNKPWVFWKAYDYVTTNGHAHGNPFITVSGDLVQNFYGLVSGDFNRSFIPGAQKSTGSVILNNKGSVAVAINTEAELPVTAEMDMNITAVSLILQYPADKIEVTGITLASDNSPVLYSVSNGELRIGFMSGNPLVVSTGQPIFNIRVKALGALVSGESARFTLVSDPLVEIAGADLQVINGASINIGVVESTVGIGEIIEAASLQLINAPNPFSDQTTIYYTLPVETHVTLDVYDLTGRKLTNLVNEHKSSGAYSAVLNGIQFAPGVYMVVLKAETDLGLFSRTIRVVRN